MIWKLWKLQNRFNVKMKQSSMKRIEPFSLVLYILSGVILLFIVAPLLSMFLNCSFGQLTETAKEKEVRDSIWLTILISMCATVLFALVAIPFSYLIARKNFPLKQLVISVVILPIVIPHSAAGIALLGIFSRNTFLGKAVDKLGFSFVNSKLGIMIAMAFVSIPFLITSARDGFLAVSERLEKAALNLGASPLKVFLTVSVPLAWRPIVSGLVLMWARGISEFGAVLIIAYHPMITPVLIYERFSAYGLKYARPVATVFVSVCLMLFIILRFLAKGKNDAYS